MAKGGYQVISFAGFTGASGEKITGAYAKASSGKAILVEDFNQDGVSISGFGIAVPATDTDVSIFLSFGKVVLDINITNEDVVSITTTKLATE